MIKKREFPRFAVCVDNSGYRASLETGKLYRVVPDSDGEKHGLIRVIDESGEDYGYSADRFFALAVPSRLEKKIFKAIWPARQTRRSPKPGNRVAPKTVAKKRLATG